MGTCRLQSLLGARTGLQLKVKFGAVVFPLDVPPAATQLALEQGTSRLPCLCVPVGASQPGRPGVMLVPLPEGCEPLSSGRRSRAPFLASLVAPAAIFH